MPQTYKVHTAGPARCDTGYRSKLVEVSSDNSRVTCHICLYRLGLYVPLSKLKEHQRAQGKNALLTPAFVTAGILPYFQ